MPLSVSLHDAVRVLAKHLRDLERSFRRPQPVASPCQGRRSPQQIHGAAGMSPRLRRSDVRVTRRRRTGRCRTTDPMNTRFTLTDRQPHLAASTTNRLDQPELCNCRSDTTVHPPGTRLDGVATTFPACSTLEASEMRWNLHRPGVDASRSPWNRVASAPCTSAPRQAGSRRWCAPPSAVLSRQIESSGRWLECCLGTIDVATDDSVRVRVLVLLADSTTSTPRPRDLNETDDHRGASARSQWQRMHPDYPSPIATARIRDELGVARPR